MACKLIIQSSDGVDRAKLKIKSPAFAPLVGDSVQTQTEADHIEYKVLSRSFAYDEDGDVKILVRCEQVGANSAREIDD